MAKKDTYIAHSTPDLVGMVQLMLANLMGPDNRLYELPVQFEERMPDRDRKGEITYANAFPDDMKLEKDMMRALHYIAGDPNLKPYPATVANVIKNIMFQVYPDINKSVDEISAQSTPDGTVRELSIYIAERLRNIEANIVIEKARNLVQLPLGELNDRLDEAVELIMSVRGEESDDSPTRNQEEILDWYLGDVLQQREGWRELGSYPDLKFASFKGIKDPKNEAWHVAPKIPFLKWGHTTAILAKRGVGKTTVAGVLAEHNAWRLGHDVLWIHLETEPDELIDRSIARWTDIPVDYMQKVYSLKNPNEAVKKRLERFFNWAFLKEKTWEDGRVKVNSGDIVYKYAPGWDVWRINALIRAVHMRSERRNKGLLVIVDYYDIIDYQGMHKDKSRAEAKGAIALALRDNVKKLNLKSPIHMVMFAQQNEDTQGANAQGYGSKEFGQYVQTIIAIERRIADTDHRVMIKGQYQTNFIGQDRYYHRKDESDSIMAWHITKGNNHGRGIAYTRIENALFKIEDLPLDELVTLERQGFSNNSPLSHE